MRTGYLDILRSEKTQIRPVRSVNAPGFSFDAPPLRSAAPTPIQSISTKSPIPTFPNSLIAIESTRVCRSNLTSILSLAEMELSFHSWSYSDSGAIRFASSIRPRSLSPFVSQFALFKDDALSAGLLCWTKMQAESGQTIETIVARKERERSSGDGIFVWGVGNPPSRLISSAAEASVAIPLIFSLMKSKPKLADTNPSRVVAWTSYLDRDGRRWPLPYNSVVTSRGKTNGVSKSSHYALICRSNTPLAIRRGVPFQSGAWRNAGRGGKPVGSSQVTALVEPSNAVDPISDYESNILATLHADLWVRLAAPVTMTADDLVELDGAAGMSDSEWSRFALGLRDRPLETSK